MLKLYPIWNFFGVAALSNRGGRTQIDLTADIIKPFYKDIEKYVTNEKVRREMDSWPNNVRLSKYVVW